MKKQINKIILFSALAIIVIILSFLFLLNKDFSIVELSHREKVTNDGAELWIYNSIPITVVDKIKEYIIFNGYNSDSLTFIFENSRNSYNKEYSSDFSKKEKNGTFVYYISESYNNIYVGSISIDEKLNINEYEGFMTERDLSQFNITPDVGSLKAISKAKEYVGEDKKLISKKRMFYRISDNNIKMCYRLEFPEYGYIYIDGVTCEIIEG